MTGLSCNAWYPQCEFKLQSWASLPFLCSLVACELPRDCGLFNNVCQLCSGTALWFYVSVQPPHELNFPAIKSSLMTGENEMHWNIDRCIEYCTLHAVVLQLCRVDRTCKNRSDDMTNGKWKWNAIDGRPACTFSGGCTIWVIGQLQQ